MFGDGMWLVNTIRFRDADRADAHGDKLHRRHDVDDDEQDADVASGVLNTARRFSVYTTTGMLQ